ncbi:MAG: phosphatase PAP2 family protein, partial [Propionibacteriales bacterium]|nr:phosphatase PAP2 family protein [Propionibacteriales bacterium]
LLLVWAAILAVVLAVGLLLTGPLQGSVGVTENDWEAWIAAHRSAGLTRAADAVSYLGDTTTELILGPTLMVAAWLWRRAVGPVVFLGSLIAGEIALYLVAVNVVGRQRPPVPLLDRGLGPTHSYPSGHVAAATAIYGGIAALIWLSIGDRRRWLGAPLLVLPPLVAVARLYQGVHHVSDVVASLLFVSIWLATNAVLVLREPTVR